MTIHADSLTQTFQRLLPGTPKPANGVLLMLRPNSDNTTLVSYARTFDDTAALCTYLRAYSAPEGFHFHLSNLDLREHDLSGAGLDKARLTDCDLSKANMTGIHMRGVELIRSTMNGADLRHADLKLSWLDGIDFSNADLDHADMTDSVCTSANFSDAKMRRTRLSGSCAQTAIFTGADMRDSEIQDAHLEQTHCANADMRGSVIDGSDISRADFSGVRVTRRQMSTTKGSPFFHPGIRPEKMRGIRRIGR